MTLRALRAIVGARLRAERRPLVFAFASAAIVGYFATRSLPGAMYFCSTIGIALGLLQGPGRNVYLDTSERSAPLFGRELARAKALAPVAGASIATLVYWAAQAWNGFIAPPVFIAVSLACVMAATLVTLNVPVRSGWERVVAFVLALVTVVAAAVLAKSDGAVGTVTELLFCTIVGFFALRQYGESLR